MMANSGSDETLITAKNENNEAFNASSLCPALFV
jgi:hypothetical protein